jgi:hypothetical protein
MLVVRYVFRKLASSRGLPHHNKKLWTPGEPRPPVSPDAAAGAFSVINAHPFPNTMRRNASYSRAGKPTCTSRRRMSAFGQQMG